MKIDSNHWDDYDDLDDTKKLHKISRKPKIMKQQQKSAIKQHIRKENKHNQVAEIDFDKLI